MILLFVGAGGSAATDPNRYPTTRQFFERLPKEVKEAPLFNDICHFLQQTGKDKPDIEDVLETLDEFQAGLRNITNTREITGWMASGKGHVLNQSPAAAFQADAREKTTEIITPLTSLIQEQVYTFYGSRPDSERLATWVYFLRELAKLDPVLEIFTTNYDLVLESAIEEAAIEVDQGLIPHGRHMALETDYWGAAGLNLLRGKGGLLTKLHGSVDWQRHNRNIVVTLPHFSGKHERHCLLYPGYKGTPT